jgi:hypothetical protein
MAPPRLDPQIGGEVSFDLGEFRRLVSSPIHTKSDSRMKNQADR